VFAFEDLDVAVAGPGEGDGGARAEDAASDDEDDTVPKFVQLIKLVQQQVGMGNARVRPPRLELVGTELEEALAIIRQAL
jgi:hypothetical protein